MIAMIGLVICAYVFSRSIEKILAKSTGVITKLAFLGALLIAVGGFVTMLTISASMSNMMAGY